MIISRTEKKIKEENLGAYRIPELHLAIGAEKVRFSPKGRNVIGAKGRVDLIGDLDSITLVLEPEGHWNIIISRAPRHEEPLDVKSLTAALKRVMR